MNGSQHNILICIFNLVQNGPMVALHHTDVSFFLFFFFALLAAWLSSVGPDWNILTTRQGVITFCTDIQGPHRMDSNNLHDPLAFPGSSPWGCRLCFTLKYLDNYWMDRHEVCFRYSRSPWGYILMTFNPLTLALVPQAGQHVSQNVLP